MKNGKTLVLVLLFFCGCNESPDNNSSNKNTGTKNEVPESVKNLIALVQQHPDSIGIRLALANAFDSIGYYKEALAQMDSLVKKDSMNYGLWFNKGQIAEDAKDTTEAIKSYIKAINVYQSPDALLALANLYAERKNDRALLICSRVKDLGLGREYDAGCAFITGVYFARTGNKQQALNFFDESIANNYTYMQAYIEKGLVYFDDKQYNEALKVFQFASKINALDADPYYWQGRCYEMMNIKDSAILRFKQSLSLDKNACETKEALKRVEAKDK